MDKIERYKNLNEEVNRLLRKHQVSSLHEEAVVAAQELAETLQDPNRVTALMRAGLVDTGRISRVRSALKDPEKAIKNPSIRTDLINMLMSLINIVTSNPSAYSSVRKGLKGSGGEEEPVSEELVGNQYKLDLNKNNKIDAEDLELLRSKKKVSSVDEGFFGKLFGSKSEKSPDFKEIAYHNLKMSEKLVQSKDKKHTSKWGEGFRAYNKIAVRHIFRGPNEIPTDPEARAGWLEAKRMAEKGERHTESSPERERDKTALARQKEIEAQRSQKKADGPVVGIDDQAPGSIVRARNGFRAKNKEGNIRYFDDEKEAKMWLAGTLPDHVRSKRDKRDFRDA